MSSHYTKVSAVNAKAASQVNHRKKVLRQEELIYKYIHEAIQEGEEQVTIRLPQMYAKVRKGLVEEGYKVVDNMLTEVLVKQLKGVEVGSADYTISWEHIKLPVDETKG